ncbi:cyclin-dependent serine/threonine protein kinase [Datura stramonium]|uniref:Cyclin-dependent serine/threonine protein kinase n=1 Tax=Datura stramonium TaxID=4076 RepID=A0ABS8S7Z0_DATST|nr:cyclin-dependent serine/threonine protein kinase [Datura stramonium]
MKGLMILLEVHTMLHLRPFWARTESGIFRAILKTDPNFDEAPWPSLSSDAVDFVKRLLNKDYRKRLTAAQALSHPWLAGHHDVKIPLDMIVYKLVKAYVYSSSLRKAALRAVMKNSTDAMKDSRVFDFVNTELGLSPSVPVHVVLQDWIRHSDGKLSFWDLLGLLPYQDQNVAIRGPIGRNRNKISNSYFSPGIVCLFSLLVKNASPHIVIKEEGELICLWTKRWADSSCAMDSLYDLDLISDTVPVILDNSEMWHQVLETSMKLGSRGVAHVEGVKED